jgi:hypothetical protein
MIDGFGAVFIYWCCVWGNVGELLMSNGWWPCFYYLSFEQSWPHLFNVGRGPRNNELKNISEVDHSIKHLTIQWGVLLLFLGRDFASELSLEIQLRKGSSDEWHSHFEINSLFLTINIFGGMCFIYLRGQMMWRGITCCLVKTQTLERNIKCNNFFSLMIRWWLWMIWKSSSIQSSNQSSNHPGINIMIELCLFFLFHWYHHCWLLDP